jgi:hypothetical protein
MIWEGILRATERVSVRKPEGKSHLGYIGVDMRIILSWIVRKRVAAY